MRVISKVYDEYEYYSLARRRSRFQASPHRLSPPSTLLVVKVRVPENATSRWFPPAVACAYHSQHPGAINDMTSIRLS